MKIINWKRFFPVAGMLAACQLSPVRAEQAALLHNPDAQARQELSATIARLTGAAQLTLSDQDFTESSYLVVERVHQYDAKGDMLQGRDLEMPHRFQLILQQNACWLVHQNSEQRVLLRKARCLAK